LLGVQRASKCRNINFTGQGASAALRFLLHWALNRHKAEFEN
jgi:hypothetical protein